MTAYLSVRDLDVASQRVFCRVDFNVPLDGARVADDARIAASLPTIRLLLERGAKLILASHLGRPKGKPVPAMSLAPAARRLSELLGAEVPLAPDCIGPETAELVARLAPGRALMLENLRFHPEEEKNDPAFSAALAALADIYVNDAFGSAHRAHASTVGVAKLLGQAASGLLMDAELRNLSLLLSGAEKPYVAVLGGAKVSDKLDLIRNLMARVDSILVGGAMAYTFLKATGVEIGESRLEADLVDTARVPAGGSGQARRPLVLPSDHRVRLTADASIVTTSGVAIPAGGSGLDIGPATIRAFTQRLAGAKTVLWNGPVGLFEEPPSTRGAARSPGRSSRRRRTRSRAAATPPRRSAGSVSSIASPTSRRGAAPRSSTSRACRCRASRRSLPPGACTRENAPRRRQLEDERHRGRGRGPARRAAAPPREPPAANPEIALAPPFTMLDRVGARLRGTGISLAAQDLHPATHGAFTGEISAGMLVDLGVRYVIVGHSERRRLFGESDEETSRKAAAAAGAGLVPILCVGEEESERIAGETLQVISRQLRTGLSRLGALTPERIVIAYEPVWAIGTGRTATPEQAGEVHRAVRGLLAELAGAQAAGGIRILYGGSATPDSVPAIARDPDVDGALVGGASLVAPLFDALVEIFARARPAGTA